MKKAILDHKAQRSLIRYCFFFVLIAVSTQTFAQDKTRGRVEVVKDPLMDTLIAKRFTLNKETGIAPGVSSSYGYRVQFFSGSSRQDAFNAQARLQRDFPELRTYIQYSEPNFKVRAGDFRTRLEAQKLVKELRQSFSSIFIISEKINLPKTDTSND